MDDRQRKDVENCICSILTSNPIRMTVQDLNRDFRNMIGHPVPYKKLGFNQLDDYLRSIPERVQVIGSGLFAEVRVVVNNKTAHINDLICKQKVNKNPRACRNGLRKYVTPRMLTRQFYQSGPREYPKPQPASTPNGAPQISTPERVQTSTPKTASPAAAADKKLPSDDDDDTLVPFGVRKRLRDLVLEYPGGVLCSRIPELYRQKFNQTFDYHTYGYRSVAQLCLDMPLTFKYQHCRNGDVRIFDSSVAMPESSEQPATSRPTKVKISEKKNTEPALPDNVEDILLGFHRAKMPENAILVDNIGRQWIGPEVAVLDFVDVYVADVYDPSKFWIHLKEYTEELDELMDDMQDFYQEHKTQYEVPFYALKKDMYIACMFSKEYHRAKIMDTSKKMQSVLKVFFIDYGTFATVFTSGILYLDKAFVELPAQAIRARLHGIQPVVKDEFWPREASVRFLNLVKRKEHLVAQIMWIDNVEQVLDIVLADTSVPDEDFYINDALVSEGYAKFLDETQDEPQPKDYTPSVQCIHLFPTHGELENGSAPNLYLMAVLEHSNISTPSIFPQYFTKIAETASNATNEFNNIEEDHQNDDDPKELSWADKFELEEMESLRRAASTSSTSPITEEDNTATAEVMPENSAPSGVEKPIRPPPGFPQVPPPYQAHYSPPGFTQQVDPRLLMLCANAAHFTNLGFQNPYPPAQYTNFSPFNNYNFHFGMYENPMLHFNNTSPPYFSPPYNPPGNFSFFHNHYHSQLRNVGNFSPPQNFPPNQNIYSRPQNQYAHQNFPQPHNPNVDSRCHENSSVSFMKVADKKTDNFSAQQNFPHAHNLNVDSRCHENSSITITKPEDQKNDTINLCDRNNPIMDQNSNKPEDHKRDDFSAQLNLPHPHPHKTNPDEDPVINESPLRIECDTENAETPEDTNLNIDEQQDNQPYVSKEDHNANYKINDPSPELVCDDHRSDRNIDEGNLQDKCSTESYSCADKQRNDLVEVVSIGGLSYHLLYFRNKRFLIIKELLQNLMGAVVPTIMIQRRFNISPPFVDILSVSLSDKPELAENLLRYNLIEENGESIDIVSVDDSEHVITVLKGTSDNKSCNAFLRNIKTV